MAKKPGFRDSGDEGVAPRKGDFIAPPFFSGRQYNVILGDRNELRPVSDIGPCIDPNNRRILRPWRDPRRADCKPRAPCFGATVENVHDCPETL